jgi:hypothetical protein
LVALKRRTTLAALLLQVIDLVASALFAEDAEEPYAKKICSQYISARRSRILSLPASVLGRASLNIPTLLNVSVKTGSFRFEPRYSSVPFFATELLPLITNSSNQSLKPFMGSSATLIARFEIEGAGLL